MGKSKAGIFGHQTDLAQGRVKSKSLCQDLSLRLIFAAAVFYLAQPYIILAPVRATQLLLGVVFSTGTRMAAKAQALFFHFEVSKTVASDSTVLGDIKSTKKVSDLLVSNAPPSQLEQHFPTFTYIFLAAR